MQNKSSEEAIIEVRSGPDIKKHEPPAPPNWTAIAAIVISIGTFLKSLWSDWRGRSEKRASQFETNYGSPIRSGLRDLEKSIRTIRSFTLPPAKPLPDVILEIETLRGGWIAAADEFAALLSEVDIAVDLAEPHWSAAFGRWATLAETALTSIEVSSVPSDLKLMAITSEALDSYNNGILEVRARLQTQLESLSGVKLRRPI